MIEGAPAYFTVPALRAEAAPEIHPGGAWWGELVLDSVTAARLHVGSGVPYLLQGDSAPDELVADIARRHVRRVGDAPVPVIPGSGVKGAVRAVVEAITPSCDPLDQRDACGPRDAPCPACTLFGTLRRRALVSFDDAVPSTPDIDLEVLDVDQRYSHADAPRLGRRLYDLTPEETTGANREALLCVPEGVGFRLRLSLRGVPDWGCGLLALTLGVPEAGPAALPVLRVGGAKNRGMGVLRTTTLDGWVTSGLPSALGTTTRRAPADLVAEWADSAVATFAPHLAERLALIRPHYGRPT